MSSNEKILLLCSFCNLIAIPLASLGRFFKSISDYLCTLTIFTIFAATLHAIVIYKGIAPPVMGTIVFYYATVAYMLGALGALVALRTVTRKTLGR